MYAILVSILALIKLGESYSILKHENVTEYELVHFNLEEFYSLGVVEFDYNDQHYKVELFKNGHISPVINHQTDKNVTTHYRKPEDSWYVYIYL